VKLASIPLALLLALAVLSPSFAGPSVDTDGDTVFDVLDNCRLLANKAPLDCDTDDDGYGNRCDGDFDNNNSTSAIDFGIFVPSFKSGVPTAKGTDMDCSGVVNANDFGLFVPNFKAGKPGPSGLHCAGTVPCDL
jgi:hypothetical protein